MKSPTMILTTHFRQMKKIRRWMQSTLICGPITAIDMHRIDQKHELALEARNLFKRCAAFLASDLEYEWPPYKWVARTISYCAFLGARKKSMSSLNVLRVTVISACGRSSGRRIISNFAQVILTAY